MTLLQRIILFYTLTLLSALALIGFWSRVEFRNQLERIRENGVDSVMVENGPEEEAMEIVLYAGVPSVLIGVLSGVLLMRRALRPIQTLTEALEKTEVGNLAAPVPRSGNGDELDRMGVVFNGMKERLARSFTQTREFTLHASHELKTPLMIMHGTLEQMLSEEVAGDAAKERVASLLEEVQRLSGIVGQLTFLARADAGLLATATDSIALHELVRDLAEETVILAAGAGIRVNLAGCEEVRVSGDRMRLRQLLLNLADNAVKYNVRHGSIELSLSWHDGAAVFTMINTGSTLPEQSRPRVFERFYRGDPAHSDQVEGTGLGLSIAQSIVEAHHGRISYEVLPDGRTCVTVTLPAGAYD
jgi:signal transduction histidine kinase